MRRVLIAVGLLAMAASAPGCITVKASLATDSGPSATGWSTLDQQLVHVGEHVEFSMVLARSLRSPAPMDPFGVADYCIATIGSEPIEADLDLAGHFRFSYDMAGKPSGEVVRVSAAAYRQRGRRDMVKIGDLWVRANDPYDQVDHLVARDSLELIVYSSHLELPVRRPGDDLDMASGRLEIRRYNGETTDVYSHERQGGGFHFTGPDEDGFYRVIYDPTAEELNKYGTTPVRFSANDAAGNPHVTEALIDTP